MENVVYSVKPVLTGVTDDGWLTHEPFDGQPVILVTKAGLDKICAWCVAHGEPLEFPVCGKCSQP